VFGYPVKSRFVNNIYPKNIFCIIHPIKIDVRPIYHYFLVSQADLQYLKQRKETSW